MRIRHIEYFLVLCEEQNFTRAAKRCGLTQPAFTHAIKKMEALFGGRLFDRVGNRTSVTKPTTLALVVKPHFERVLSEVEAAQRNASKHNAAPEYRARNALDLGGRHGNLELA